VPQSIRVMLVAEGPCDGDNLHHSAGLLRREVRLTRNGELHRYIDYRVLKPVAPPPALRPAGIIARLATCAILSRTEKRPLNAVARQHFAADRDLAALIEPRTVTDAAMTSVAGWASELVGVAVQDIAANLLPASAQPAQHRRQRGPCDSHGRASGCDQHAGLAERCERTDTEPVANRERCDSGARAAPQAWAAAAASLGRWFPEKRSLDLFSASAFHFCSSAWSKSARHSALESK
jgi:hypothetical protein